MWFWVTEKIWTRYPLRDPALLENSMERDLGKLFKDSPDTSNN